MTVPLPYCVTFAKSLALSGPSVRTSELVLQTITTQALSFLFEARGGAERPQLAGSCTDYKC